MDDLSEYKDLYLQTGKEYVLILNKNLLTLEKNSADMDAIAAVFDSAHSLKSQSAAMGYTTTAFLCHTIEDIFFEIKKGSMILTPELADHLFFAFDALASSLDNIEHEGKERNLSSHAETLKKLTGIKTEGGGKSNRKNEAIKKETQATKVADEIAPTPIEAKVDTTKQISTINVKVEHLDDMMNLMEELLVHRLKLKNLSEEIANDELRNYFDVTQKILGNLQYKVMQARTIPLNVVFDHFPRAVRDLARSENKEITFLMEGGDLELDRSIVDRLDEPLIHLLRNAVAHGIEKSGTITLKAFRERDYAVIQVTDDGVGIDWERVAQKAHEVSKDESVLKKLLFSGISTTEIVTEVSGRGVGLRVVKNMVEGFGGRIDVQTKKGHGTTFMLKLPLTLAVTKALLMKVGTDHFALPVLLIDRSIRIKAHELKKVADQEAFVLGTQEIPLLRLADIFKQKESNEPSKQNTNTLAVIVSIENEKVGLVVDEIIETLEIIVKPIPPVLKNTRAFSGTTVLGDGKAALIINPEGLLKA